MFRPHWVCPAQGVCAFPVYTAQAPGCSIWSGPCVECGSSFRVLHNSAGSVAPAFCAFPSLSSSGSQRLGRPLPGVARLFPPRPQCASMVRCLRLAFVHRRWPLAASLPAEDVNNRKSQEVFRQEPGPVCRVGGGGFSGAEFSPCPSPCLLPPGGWAGSSLEFLSPFVLQTAGGVFGSVLVFSLAIPQSKKAPSDCSQGLRAGPYPKQCRPLLSISPPLAGGRCGRLGYFSAGSCF